MHELSIVQSIITTVSQSIPIEKHRGVKYIYLKIGVLSGIEIDALFFSFDLLKERTDFSGASLSVEILEAEGICSHCQNKFYFSSYGTACPSCGNYDIQITQGKEMLVTGVEIE